MNVYIPIDSPAVEGKVFDDIAVNPGVGGVEYLSVCLGVSLSLKYPDIQVRLISDHQFVIRCQPPNLTVIVHPTAEIFKLPAASPVAFILTVSVARRQRDEELRAHAKDIVLWSHHPSDWRVIKYSRILSSMVSTGSYQFLSNLHYFKRHALISNLFYRRQQSHPTITPGRPTFDILFLGALVKAKGFHHVLRYWREIKEKVPVARLHVVGGANLYGLSQSPRDLIPCDAIYRRMLTDIIEKNDIDMSDVIFYGALGAERFKLYELAHVAIVNPSGVSESFSYNVHECFDHAVPVISSSDYGLNDTMKYFPELTLSRPSQLPERVAFVYENRGHMKCWRIRAQSIAHNAELRNATTLEQWGDLIFGRLVSQRRPALHSAVQFKALIRYLMGYIKHYLNMALSLRH